MCPATPVLLTAKLAADVVETVQPFVVDPGALTFAALDFASIYVFQACAGVVGCVAHTVTWVIADVK